MNRILIVEDDENLSRGIKLALRQDYSCIQAFSAQEALECSRRQQPDLILLDVNLPDKSGMEVLEEIRKSSQVPVILLTANNMEMDIVAGLESGANDYITKPFSLMVLRARVGVQLRNRQTGANIFKSGSFCFDFDKMEFTKGSECLELSKTEQRLLRCLVESKGKSLSRSRLIDEVWQGDTEFVDEHALTVAINRLRRKLGSGQDDAECIRTIYGVGYAWVES
ncbi:MAG: response regulator transcription factor [Firmicutes bacterium]|nr:response regulator transcription factor [Bacillota bacterium]